MALPRIFKCMLYITKTKEIQILGFSWLAQCSWELSQSIAGDILGNLIVRMSDSWEKSALRKIFEILFWLETSKNDHSMQVRLQVPLFPEIALLFSRFALLFPRTALLFSRSVLLLSGIAFLFLKNARFSRIAFFLFTVRLFPRMFFPADCTCSSCSKLLWQILITLLLFCFLTQLFIDQLIIPSW